MPSIHIGCPEIRIEVCRRNAIILALAILLVYRNRKLDIGKNQSCIMREVKHSQVAKNKDARNQDHAKNQTKQKTNSRRYFDSAGVDLNAALRIQLERMRCGLRWRRIRAREGQYCDWHLPGTNQHIMTLSRSEYESRVQAGERRERAA